MLQDLRYAFRTLWAAPGFTAVAALTLALGIGANTAIFSAINAVLLEPLPYREAHRIAKLHEGRPDFQLNVSYPNFLDWRERSRAFQDMAIFNTYGRAIVQAGGRSEAVPAGTLESQLLHLLDLMPVRGRVFTPEEEQRGGPGAVLISDALWRRLFAGAESVVGSAVTVGDEPVTIVGILPPAFTLNGIDLWYPLAAGIGPMQMDRGNHPGFQVYARLRDGVTFERAQQEMASIAADLERQHPVTNHQMGVFVRPLLDTVVGRVRPMLYVLAGAVGFLLLIACANVANVLLARGLRRERETAIRAALGAGRARLMRLFLAESLAVALLGGAVGVLLAAWSIRAFRSAAAVVVPRSADISLDTPVLAFALLLTAVTSIVFGLAPSLQLSRAPLGDALRQAGALSGRPGSGRRLRSTLVAVEVALSLMLLVGAGLMLRTLARLSTVDPGFRAEGLLAVRTLQPPSLGKDEDRTQFADRLVAELAHAPGVAAAAVAWPLDLVGFSWSPYANFRHRPFAAGKEPAVQMAAVSPAYFAAMGIPVKRGRTFDDRDRAGTPVVAVINETTARRYFAEGDPIGQRMSLVGIPELADMAVVGVVGDTLRGGPTGRVSSEVYCAYAQFPAASPTLVVRAAAGDPLQLVRIVEDRVSAVQPSVATHGARRLSDAIAGTFGDRRLLSSLLMLFAAVALGLTALGLGGVVAYLVAQRTQEIGIRMALGADAGSVVRLVIRNAMAPVLAGAALGTVAIYPFASLLRSFLFGIGWMDGWSIAGAAALLLTSAAIAAYLPARRASRIDPLVALRTS